MTSQYQVGDIVPTIDGKSSVCVHVFTDGRLAFVATSINGDEYVYPANKNGYPTDGSTRKHPLLVDTIAEMFS